KDVADTLAGVAIATSLEPAVATIGLSLASNTHEIELGAALLFITNLVCIILAGWAVFFWMGMRPRLIDKSRQRQYISWALVMFMALPIVIILLNLSNRGIATSTVSKRLQ